MRKSAWSLSLVLFLMLGGLFAPPIGLAMEDDCELVPDILTRAAELSRNNKRSDSIRQYQRAYDLCPSDVNIVYDLGMAFYNNGQKDESVKFFQEAVRRDASNASWCNNLAWVLFEQKRYEESLSYAERAARLDSRDLAIQDTLAQARAAAGDPVGALKGLQPYVKNGKLTDTYNKIFENFLVLALQSIINNQEETGLSELKSALFDPKGQAIYINALIRLRHYDLAFSAAEGARINFPKNPDIEDAFKVTVIYITKNLYDNFLSGEKSKSVRAAKKLAELYPDQLDFVTAYRDLHKAFIDETQPKIPSPINRVSPIGFSSRVSREVDKLVASIGSGSGNMDIAIDVDRNIPKGTMADKDDVAVIIGNRTYSNGVPNVDFALRDARTMKDYLINTLGFSSSNIIYEENANSAKFREIFGNESDPSGKLLSMVTPGKSKVFVYYVGHGAPDINGEDSFFVPVDVDPQYLKSNGYRLQTFYNNLDKLPSDSLTVMIDACFSGDSASGQLHKGVSAITLRELPSTIQPTSATVFSSSRDDQVSAWYPEKQHSLFTYYFLLGLRGEADKDKNSSITVAEMESFLEENVSGMAMRLKGNKQQPVIKGEKERVLVTLTKK